MWPREKMHSNYDHILSMALRQSGNCWNHPELRLDVWCFISLPLSPRAYLKPQCSWGTRWQVNSLTCKPQRGKFTTQLSDWYLTRYRWTDSEKVLPEANGCLKIEGKAPGEKMLRSLRCLLDIFPARETLSKQWVYSFPISATANYYTLSHWKQHRCIILQPWSFRSPEIKCGQDSREGSRGESVSLPFPASRSTCSPFFHLQSAPLPYRHILFSDLSAHLI